MITDDDLKHLQRCIALAKDALEDGSNPFGSVLVSAEGSVLREARNRVSTGDNTRHPEFELARWAAENMTEEDRAASTVYTSGEHCPMCAAAHGLVGLGRIVYATSSVQRLKWLEEIKAPPAPIRYPSIQDILVDAVVEGPVPQFAEDVRALHVRRYNSK